jgi:hypothetical protein
LSSIRRTGSPQIDVSGADLPMDLADARLFTLDDDFRVSRLKGRRHFTLLRG